ncbi:MAG: protein kinase [Verrucomicrobia bacterium]|nr:protein kinase [Verrucomicrobiota bacterium]
MLARPRVRNGCMTTESSVLKCPMCGAALPPKAPEGLCPKCLLAAVAAPTEMGAGNPPRSQPPPSREALEAAFPQLEILELIGQGGMGAVFKARQPKLNRFVALKILPESLGRDPKFAERFAREGQLLARLNHPNIVTVHDFGQAGGFFYLLMEFVDGVNLRQAMRAGRFTAAQALGIVPKICEALQYAHDEGVLHRDIKPENILLDTKGRVKLADFGIAKFIGDVEAADLAASSAAPEAAAASPQLTSGSAALGTPDYMAPEQRERPAEVDHRADIYSLGVVFYEMLTGELPVGKFAPPSEKSASDPRVDEVVLRALEQERERRQQSAGEIKTQVETITNTPQQTTEAPPARLRAPLKSGRSYFTTPEHLATFFGGFWWPRNTGELALHEDRLVFTVGWERTEIPFASLLEVGAARCPRWMSPAGHQYLLVTYDDRGQRKRLLFMPGTGLFRTAPDTEQIAAEWIMAIRDAVKTATGKNLPCGTGEPTVVPASPWGTLLVLLPPLLVGFLALRELMTPRSYGGSGSSSKWSLATMLILFVLGFGGAVAALGGNWFHRRNRSPAQNQWARGLRFGVLLMVLLPFAAFVASFVLSRFEVGTALQMPAIMEPAPAQPLLVDPPRLAPNAGAITGVHTEKGMATIEARLDGQQELRVFVGEESLGWSMPAGEGGAVTAIVEASSQIRLEDGSLGVGFIFRAGGSTTNVTLIPDGPRQNRAWSPITWGSTTYVAIIPDGPVPFGALEFREDKDIAAKEGTYTFADIRKAGGMLVPVSVKVRRKPGVPVAVQKLSFGSVMERTLPLSKLGYSWSLNLETDEMRLMPATLTMADWSSGISLPDGIVVVAPEKDRTLMIAGTGTKVVPLLNSAQSWETPTPAQLDITDEPQPGQTESVSGEKPSPPVTFAFRTQKGARGLLQITGFTDNPRCVTIRYKLAQGEKVSSATAIKDEIIRLAREQAKDMRIRHKNGVATTDELVEAEGELAIAEARGDAVKQAEARLATTTKILELVELRFKSGTVSNAEASRARQRKLEAELELQRARVAAPLPATPPEARVASPQTGRDLLAALQGDLAALRVNHGEEHPDVKALRARIAAVEAALRKGEDPMLAKLRGDLAAILQTHGTQQPETVALRARVAAIEASLAKGEDASLAQLRGELAAMSQTYGEQHPRIKELRARIAALESFGKSAGAPAAAPNLSPKQFSLGLFTNQNGHATVNSQTMLAPGETLKSWLVHADGRREPAISLESVFGHGEIESGICGWSWRLPPPFDTNRTDEVVAQLLERWQGKLLSCPPGQSITLFALTNEFGARVSGELQFDRTTADPTKPAVAEVKLRNQMTSLLFFTSQVPAGYSLNIRSTGTEVHAAHSTLSRSFSKYSDDATCSWHWTDSDYRGDVSTTTAKQVLALFAQGPLLITNGQPRTVFSVTNASGSVYAGQFELRGPTTTK